MASSSAQASTDYKEAFKLYDRLGHGMVPLESLGDLLRACGQNPTLADIAELEKSVARDFDFDTFSKVLNRPGGFMEPLPLEEYAKAFEVFDKRGNGEIARGELKYVLENLGERLSPEETDELLKMLDPKAEHVKYYDIINNIVSS